jgi:hypothetical protein
MSRLVLRLRITGVVLLLPLYTLVFWKGMILSLNDMEFSRKCISVSLTIHKKVKFVTCHEGPEGE